MWRFYFFLYKAQSNTGNEMRMLSTTVCCYGKTQDTEQNTGSPGQVKSKHVLSRITTWTSTSFWFTYAVSLVRMRGGCMRTNHHCCLDSLHQERGCAVNGSQRSPGCQKQDKMLLLIIVTSHMSQVQTHDLWFGISHKEWTEFVNAVPQR